MEIGFEVRNVLLQRLGRQVPLEWLALAPLGEERLKKRPNSRFQRAIPVNFAQFRRELPIARLASVEPPRPGLAMPPAYIAPEHFGFDASGRLPVREAERASQRRGEGRSVVEGCKRLNEALDLPQEIIESEGADVARHAFQRSPDKRVSGGYDRFISRLFHERSGLALVEHPERRRDIRLEREELQKPFAEGVKGLDPQAPGCLDRAREQLSGEYEILRARLSGAGLGDRGGERFVAEARPLRERIEDASRMLAAAALVKVRPRICPGDVPVSRR